MNARPEIASDNAPVAFHEAALWRQLIEAIDLKAFCTAWLSLQCSMIAGSARGIVMLSGDQPVAVWPENAESSDLVGVATVAASQRKGVVQKREAAGPNLAPGQWELAYPALVDDKLLGAVAIILHPDSGGDLRHAARQLQWGMAWLRERLQQDAFETAVSGNLGSRIALDTLGSALQADGYKPACRAVATALAHAFDCERVSVGFTQRGRVHVAVISHSAQFGKHMNLVRLIGNAMDEAVDQRTALMQLPMPDEPYITLAHEKLSVAQDGARILTIPMLTHDRFVGAITFERNPKAAFSAQEIGILDGVVAALAPVLEEKRRNDRWLVVKIADAIGEQFVRLFGPRHWSRKLAVIAIVIAVAIGYWWTDTYRITADAVVEGREQRAVGAPFNGFVKEAPMRAGDQVAEGQVLATLDDRDLVLERLRWVTERQRKVLEHEKALGERNRAEVKIVGTQIEQADAQIRLVDEHIARARLTAPFAGLIVSGDLTQAIGATVQRGQVLFEIAPLDAYRIALEVDESQIGDVTERQSGWLVVSSLPNETIPLTIDKITPVAKAHDGRNFFRVEARLGESAPQLRPGMRGVAKLDVDRRRVIWIWTRSFVQWLRLFAWRWLG